MKFFDKNIFFCYNRRNAVPFIGKFSMKGGAVMFSWAIAFGIGVLSGIVANYISKKFF